MGTLAILSPAVVNTLLSGRSDWDGGVFTTEGFSGYDGTDWGSNNAHLIAALLQTGDPYSGGLNGKGLWFLENPPGTGNPDISYGFDQNTPIFILDGGAPISFNSLPGGFSITALTFTINGYNNQFGIDPPGVIALTVDGNIIVPVITNPSAGVFKYAFTVDIINDIFSGNPISALDLLGVEILFDCEVVSDGVSSSIPAVIEWVMSGTYTSISQTWTLEVPDEPVEAGDSITITSDPGDPDAMDFEQITSVTIEYIDANGDPQEIDVPSGSWTIVETNEFVFTMPAFPDDMLWFSIVVESTQFSGSVTLGQLITLFFTSASGIYRLVTNKRSDTLYLENDPPNTIDVKIPDPGAKTGYIGG